MKNVFAAIFILTASMSAHAWIEQEAGHYKQIKQVAINAYKKQAAAKSADWAKKRDADLKSADDTYGGKFTGTELSSIELSRDENAYIDDGVAFNDITIQFLVYEEAKVGVHGEMINQPLSSTIVTCKLTATRDADATASTPSKLGAETCTVKPSKLISEITQ